jgi:uncharacterized protein with NRDE domain
MSDKPLKNRKYEIIAQQLARGATAVEANIAAGYPSDGAYFASNCRTRASYPKVKARVAALQAAAIERVNIDVGGLVKRLVEIASHSPYRERVRTSDSLRAIDMLLRIGGHYAPTKSESVVTPGDSRTIRMTEFFDKQGLKTRRRIVDLVQVINDENSPAEVRIAAAQAALPFLEGKEFVTEDDGGSEP